MAVRRKGWNDLSEEQRGGVVLIAIVQLALLVFAQGVLIGRPKEFVRGPKPLWFLVNFVNFLGPIAFLCFGRRRILR